MIPAPIMNRQAATGAAQGQHRPDPATLARILGHDNKIAYIREFFDRGGRISHASFRAWRRRVMVGEFDPR